MNAVQRNLLENIFRPYLDSALVTAILNDGHDFGACLDILSKLAEGTNLVQSLLIDGTENCSENDRNINKSSNSETFNNREDKQKFRDKNGADMHDVFEEYSPNLEDCLDSLDLNGDPFDSGSHARFLKGCFPALSDEKVNKLLHEYDNNLEKILDVVLNEIYLESEQLDSKSTYSSSVSSASSFDTRDEDYDDDLSSEARFKHRKKKRRRQQKSTRILLHVNGLIHNSNNPTSTAQSSEPSSKAPPPSSISEPPPPAFTTSREQNQWTKFEREIQQLANAFPTIPRKTIASTLHSNGGKYYETVLKLISICPTVPNCQQRLFHENLNHLKAVFPNHDEKILRKALNGTGSAQMASSLLLLCYDSGYGSNDGSNISSPDELDTVKNDYFNAEKLRGHNLDSVNLKNNYFNSERSKKQPDLSPSPFLPNGVQFDHDTGEYIFVQEIKKNNASNFHMKNEKVREKNRSTSPLSSNSSSTDLFSNYYATELMAKRNEAYRKAVTAFRKTKGRVQNGEGGIAFFYSDEGRKYDSEMKLWNLRAVRSVVKRDSEANKDHILLDLHGLTVAEALTVVKEGLAQWSKGTKQRSHSPIKPLKIVTGLGNHSPNGVAKLPPAVARMLSRDKWDVVRHQGYFLVRGRQTEDVIR
ncbi:13068_t:CDS:2 [Ambispora leptoticha]|uniref:13068_t:CDS:1 n=1 Tax=Ambispora leptoticha TaxID=144679 RepID=A0A9N8V6N1_9GLOM|nr:13068_t:CDS:2 [Ambispora leptoticha]